MNFKNVVKKIQAAAYNGARTVYIIHIHFFLRDKKAVGPFLIKVQNYSLV